MKKIILFTFLLFGWSIINAQVSNPLMLGILSQKKHGALPTLYVAINVNWNTYNTADVAYIHANGGIYSLQKGNTTFNVVKDTYFYVSAITNTTDKWTYILSTLTANTFSGSYQTEVQTESYLANSSADGKVVTIQTSLNNLP